MTKLTEICSYDYRDETGQLLYQVVRFVPKTFRQRRPDGKGGWIWNIDGTKKVLYRLPELLIANLDRTVFICEGEKDADNLVKRGFLATTNSGGAKKWEPEYCGDFQDRNVVIIADKDKDGRDHAQQVSAMLTGIARAVRVIEMPEGKDVSEWFELGGTPERLEELSQSNDSEIALKKLYQVFSDEADGKYQCPPLPWAKFECQSKILYPGSLSILGGPAGFGKTMFMIHAANHLHENGCEWAYLPLEGTRTDWQRRLMAHVFNDWVFVDTDQRTAEQRASKLLDSEGMMMEVTNHVCENPRLTESGTMNQISPQLVLDWTEARSKEKNRVVFIDNLTQIDFDGPKPWQAQGQFIDGLLAICQRSMMTVILAAHTVKRQGQNRKMELSGDDLAGAADINRNAHCVVLLDHHSSKESDIENTVTGPLKVQHNKTIILAKTRNGPGGGKRLAFSMNGPAFIEHGVIA